MISYLITAVSVLKNLLFMAILFRSIASSFFTNPYSKKGVFLQFLYDVSDPFINIAKKIPHQISMLDLSPMIAMIMVDLGGRFLIILLTRLA